MKPGLGSRWSLELPESPSAIEEELHKQESLLNQLHEDLMKVKDAGKEEQLWEVQRMVTQLKRKVNSKGVGYGCTFKFKGCGINSNDLGGAAHGHTAQEKGVFQGCVWHMDGCTLKFKDCGR